jgi:hypothetical protein
MTVFARIADWFWSDLEGSGGFVFDKPTPRSSAPTTVEAPPTPVETPPTPVEAPPTPVEAPPTPVEASTTERRRRTRRGDE